jgi:hypothetical protein
MQMPKEVRTMSQAADAVAEADAEAEAEAGVALPNLHTGGTGVLLT